MTDIEIKQVDSVNIKIESEKGIARELSDFFTFYVPNHQYTPAYKNKIWDGQIRLFNLHSRTVYAGLFDYVLSFAKDRNYTVSSSIKRPDGSIKKDMVEKYINEYLEPYCVDKPIKPHEHQLNAITHALNMERCLLLSPTGSGKSFIIYALIRYYLDKIPKDKKILIVVPTTNLVAQLYDDFNDYSSKSSWNAKKECHTIYAGKDKETDKRVVITTWQSVYKLHTKHFQQYGAVFGDECHLFKAKSLTTLMTKLTECPIRIGTTGTLDGTQTHKLVIEGLFGKVFKATTTKELMDKNLLSKLEIDRIILKYNDEEIQSTKRITYQEEIKWLITNQKRNEFIVKLCGSLDTNVLLLYNYVELHGKPLYEMIKKKYPERKVFMIYGGTDVDQREKIRKIVDRQKNAILVASYGTCSTGINIKNIHNIIFASPSKSVVRVLQSIGRGLRRTEDKNNVKLYDISDDLRYRKYVNHTYKHLDERIKIYNREKFIHNAAPIRL